MLDRFWDEPFALYYAEGEGEGGGQGATDSPEGEEKAQETADEPQTVEDAVKAADKAAEEAAKQDEKEAEPETKTTPADDETPAWVKKLGDRLEAIEKIVNVEEEEEQTEAEGDGVSDRVFQGIAPDKPLTRADLEKIAKRTRQIKDEEAQQSAFAALQEETRQATFDAAKELEAEGFKGIFTGKDDKPLAKKFEDAAAKILGEVDDKGGWKQKPDYKEMLKAVIRHVSGKSTAGKTTTPETVKEDSERARLESSHGGTDAGLPYDPANAKSLEEAIGMADAEEKRKKKGG